jgi:hypothetical protein
MVAIIGVNCDSEDRSIIGALVVCFYRNGELPEERHAPDGGRAAAAAISMIALALNSPPCRRAG